MTDATAGARVRIAATAPFCVLAVLGSALSGCANGDFGRVKPGLVADDVHDWVGSTAAAGNHVAVSDYPLTDDERLLRDLAYPLIEPPYERQRWYAILNEYGIGRVFRRDWSRFDVTAYNHALFAASVRSQAARYARLDDDIRNDRTRIVQFFATARRVVEMDRRREKAVAVVAQLDGRERLNAAARNAENALVVSWVQWSLAARAASYRYALERLAIAAPMTAANEVERSLVALQNQIADERVLPGPDVAPGPVDTLPPYRGPV
jgi:hypothetical protein